jgi:heptosyltransferase-2
VIPVPTSREQAHLLRLPNWLGDLILSLPAVRLYQSWLNGRAPLFVAGPASLAPLAPLLLPRLEYLSVPAWPLAMGAEMKKHNVISAVALPHSLRVALEILSVPYRAGFDRNLRNALLTEHRPRRTTPFGFVHVADQYLGLLEDLGLPKGTKELPAPPSSLPKPAEAPAKPYLTVFPGAAYGPAKRWDPTSFAAVLRDLVKEHSWEPILMGGLNDAESCQAVAEAYGPEIRDLSGKTSTLDLAHWIAHASFVLCHDSGPMHLAAFLRRPGVAIFGSTEPAWTGPLGNSVTVARHKVSCSPCFLKVCPLDRRCMTRLTPEEVLSACRHRLTSMNK